MEVLSVDNKIMTVNGKLAKAPSITGTGDMKKSVYDPTGIVQAAGGIPDYVANNAPVVSVNGKTGDVTIGEVPSVTTADNGKFLRVVNGAWAVAEVDNASGVSF